MPLQNSLREKLTFKTHLRLVQKSRHLDSVEDFYVHMYVHMCVHTLINMVHIVIQTTWTGILLLLIGFRNVTQLSLILIRSNHQLMQIGVLPLSSLALVNSHKLGIWPIKLNRVV